MKLATVFGAFWGGWVLRGYQQQVYWLQHIAPYSAGATPTSAWDADRAQVTSFTDGSFGIGWQITDSQGVLRKGYLGPQIVTVGIDDMPTTQQLQDYGVISYEGPVVIYQPPIAMSKFDVLVSPSGQRYVVGDKLTVAQVLGTAVINTSELERRVSTDPIYQIPLV